MANGLASIYFANKVLENVFGISSYSTSARYMGNINYPGETRVNLSGKIGSAVNGAASVSSLIQFPAYGAGSPVGPSFVALNSLPDIYDAATGGNLLINGQGTVNILYPGSFFASSPSAHAPQIRPDWARWKLAAGATYGTTRLDPLLDYILGGLNYAPTVEFGLVNIVGSYDFFGNFIRTSPNADLSSYSEPSGTWYTGRQNVTGSFQIIQTGSLDPYVTNTTSVTWTGATIDPTTTYWQRGIFFNGQLIQLFGPFISEFAVTPPITIAIGDFKAQLGGSSVATDLNFGLSVDHKARIQGVGESWSTIGASATMSKIIGSSPLAPVTDHVKLRIGNMMFVGYAPGTGGTVARWEVDNTGKYVASGDFWSITFQSISFVERDNGDFSFGYVDGASVKHSLWNPATQQESTRVIATGTQVDHKIHKRGDVERLVFVIWDTSAFYAVVATLGAAGEFEQISSKVNMALPSPKASTPSLIVMDDGTLSVCYVNTSNQIIRAICENLDNDAVGTWTVP